MIEKLYKLCEALENKFPGNRDPFRILARLMEESSELADQVHLYENAGRKRESGRVPDDMAPAKEIQQFLLTGLDIARYYKVEDALEQQVNMTYERVIAEGSIKLP